MLQAVAIGLLWLKDSLASRIFVESWQKLASQVNEVRNVSLSVSYKLLTIRFSSSSWKS